MKKMKSKKMSMPKPKEMMHPDKMRSMGEKDEMAKMKKMMAMNCAAK